MPSIRKPFVPSRVLRSTGGGTVSSVRGSNDSAVVAVMPGWMAGPPFRLLEWTRDERAESRRSQWEIRIVCPSESFWFGDSMRDLMDYSTSSPQLCLNRSRTCMCERVPDGRCERSCPGAPRAGIQPSPSARIHHARAGTRYDSNDWLRFGNIADAGPLRAICHVDASEWPVAISATMPGRHSHPIWQVRAAGAGLDSLRVTSIFSAHRLKWTRSAICPA